MMFAATAYSRSSAVPQPRHCTPVRVRLVSRLPQARHWAVVQAAARIRCSSWSRRMDCGPLLNGYQSDRVQVVLPAPLAPITTSSWG